VDLGNENSVFLPRLHHPRPRFLSALAKTGHQVSTCAWSSAAPAGAARPPAGGRDRPLERRQSPSRWQDGPAAAKPEKVIRKVQPDVILAAAASVPPFWRLSGFRPWSACPGLRPAARRRTQRLVAMATVTPCGAALPWSATATPFASWRSLMASRLTGGHFPWGIDLAHFTPARAASAAQAMETGSQTDLEDPGRLSPCSPPQLEPIYGVDLIARLS